MTADQNATTATSPAGALALRVLVGSCKGADMRPLTLLSDTGKFEFVPVGSIKITTKCG